MLFKLLNNSLIIAVVQWKKKLKRKKKLYGGLLIFIISEIHIKLLKYIFIVRTKWQINEMIWTKEKILLSFKREKQEIQRLIADQWKIREFQRNYFMWKTISLSCHFLIFSTLSTSDSLVIFFFFLVFQKPGRSTN